MSNKNLNRIKRLKNDLKFLNKARRDLIEVANKITMQFLDTPHAMYVVVESKQDDAFLNVDALSDNSKFERFTKSLERATVFDHYEDAEKARLKAQEHIVNDQTNDICMIKLLTVNLFEQIDRVIRHYDIRIDAVECQLDVLENF